MTVAVALDLPSERAPYLAEGDTHIARIPFSELVNRIERGERCSWLRLRWSASRAFWTRSTCRP